MKDRRSRFREHVGEDGCDGRCGFGPFERVRPVDRLDAGAERTVSLSTVIEEPGTYDVRIGAKTTTVTVTGDGSERIEDDSTDSASIEQPGFGVAVALVAVCLALIARAISVRYR